MPTRSSSFAAAATTVALLTTGARPAAASDETLKAEIDQVLVELRPTLAEFTSAARALRTAPDTSRLQKATLAFRTGISRYRWGVVNRKASTPAGLAAKKQLLTAIRGYDLGLVQYDKALVKLDGGAKKASILASLDTADRRFAKASRDETAALKALGVTTSAG